MVSRLHLFALSTLVGIVSAVPATAQPEEQTACIEDFESGVDYFPDKIEPEYAGNFTVSYRDFYKIVTVEVAYAGGPSETYVLVYCGAPEPILEGDLAEAPVIQVPLGSMFSASTTHLPMIDALGAVDRVTGVGSLAFATTEAFLAAGEAGQVIEYAAAGSPDVEVVIDADPDILMTGGSDNEAYETIADAGIPVVANAEWLETSLLGRAEWVKFIALFLNAEAAANAVFNDIETSYLDAAAAVAGLPESERPLVLAGSSFQGTFYAPGGRSYSVEAIETAGGRYVFGDNDSTSSLSFGDLEQIIAAGSEVDVWVNAATGYRTLADIAADDPRLATLPAAEAGNVWIYDRISTASGGVAFFELGVLRPDLILRDLIEVFHPGTLPDHDFVFYRTIASE